MKMSGLILEQKNILQYSKKNDRFYSLMNSHLKST